MKNKYIKIAFLSLATLGLGTSCGEDYLNRKPNQVIDTETLKEETDRNPAYFDGQLLGIYSFLFKTSQTTDGDHEDFAQKSYDLETDILSGDISLFQNAYGRFTSPSAMTTYKKTHHRSYAAWRVNYKIIGEANNLLKVYFGQDTEVPKRDKNIKDISKDKNAKLRVPYAQLMFIRAYAYYTMSTLYAGNYDEYKDKKVMPIYNLTLGSESVHEYSTLADVYQEIIKNLLQAKEVMSDTEFLNEIKYYRPNKLMADANIISTYLAYAYLTIGEYQKAYDEAKNIIDNGAVELMKAGELTTTGFNNINHPDFLWGVDVTQETTGQLLSFWGHMDMFTYSYATAGGFKLLNTHLAEEMPEYDLRKKWFDSMGGIPGFPFNKFYSETGRKVFESGGGFGGDGDWLSDIHFLRTEEIYLIAAEAAARNNNDAASKEVLLKLLKERTDEAKMAEMEAAVNAYSHEDLMKAIFYNWRIEMWGEGKALQTIKRFKATTKRSANSLYFRNKDIPYNAVEYVYEKPNLEVINNNFAK